MSTTTPRGRSGSGGELLAGRYELRGLVGQGGMADVQLAHDTMLDRDVAVKILHARYADDPAFLARFRREAQAAASLNHPNIVAVYDTGEDDGRPFIVMELVRGRSLRDLLRSEPVMPRRAAEIAADSATGLDYAHERGLVHRDIKPGNILLSEEGVVKVADFGIARAVNAENVTQTAAVFGTAAYVAPEQAQGDDVDRRTDVYALGCVLYELLTGRQPFAAENAVALAYKHVSEEPVPPSRINQEIGPDLDAVVLQTMAKDPARRYQTARELADDLRRAIAGQPVLARSASSYSATQVVRREPERTIVAPPPPVADEVIVEEPEPEPERSNAAVWWILAAVLVLAIASAVAFFYSDLFGSNAPEAEPTPTPSPVAVADVRGQPLQAAQDALRAQGFDTVVGQAVEDPEVPEGAIVSTDPPAGTALQPGQTVTLIPSAGPPQTTVPDLVGLDQNDVVPALQEARLELGERVVESSEEFGVGEIVSQDPAAGESVPEGTPVDIVISSGSANVTVPDVDGLTLQQARQRFDAACSTPPCLTPVRQEENSATVAEGLVIRTDPAPGAQVPRGSAVVVVVSLGPEEVEPPPTVAPSPTTEEPEPPPASEPTIVPTPAPTLPSRVTPGPTDPGSEPSVTPPPLPDGESR